MPINNFLLPGAKVTTVYDVANSCRFNDDDSPHLHKTNSGAGNRDTFTFSTWVKRSTLGTEQRIFSSANTSGTNAYGALQFHPTYDDLIMFHYDGSSNYSYHRTNRQFKDPSAWLHICIAVDTTQSTASNRVKIYINGSQETSFRTETTPDQNTDMQWNTAEKHWVGAGDDDSGGQSRFFDGYLAETVFIDGLQLAPTSFGEFDSDSPNIWKPKNVSGLTFGTNGFYLDYEDSGTLGNDANGGTDFTSSGLAATDQATDTPTNNFATLNPLASLPNTSKSTFSEGNCVAVGGSNASYVNGGSTIGVANGKWYVETKLTASSDGDARCITGVTMDVSEISRINQDAGANNIAYAWHYGNIAVAGSTSGYTSLTTSAVNDIVGVALDMDNGKVYFSKNGSWINSGDPTSGATGTGAAPVAASTTGLRFFFSGSDSNARTMTTAYNFGGCPAFAISSGNADANGYGNFEYPPPSGYYSLCTKNLAEYG